MSNCKSEQLKEINKKLREIYGDCSEITFKSYPCSYEVNIEEYDEWDEEGE